MGKKKLTMEEEETAMGLSLSLTSKARPFRFEEERMGRFWGVGVGGREKKAKGGVVDWWSRIEEGRRQISLWALLAIETL